MRGRQFSIRNINNAIKVSAREALNRCCVAIFCPQRRSYYIRTPKMLPNNIYSTFFVLLFKCGYCFVLTTWIYSVYTEFINLCVQLVWTYFWLGRNWSHIIMSNIWLEAHGCAIMGVSASSYRYTHVKRKHFHNVWRKLNRACVSHIFRTVITPCVGCLIIQIDTKSLW